MIWTCEQIEARLSDYLDDAMTRNDRASFEAHVGDCARCAPLVAHLSKLLTSMHVMEQIEPPPRLIYAILDQTLGKREPVTGWRAIFGWFEGITTMREVTGGTPYGATCVTGSGSEARMPSELELHMCRFQGEHVARIASRLVAGGASRS